MANLKVDQIAGLFNLTPRRVQQLKKEGMPGAGRGEYDPVACTRWYIRYLQGLLEQRGPTGTQENAQIAAERKRLVAAQAERAEMENEARRRTLVSVEEVVEVWAGHISGAKQRLLGIPAKVAPQLTNTADANRIAARLKDEIESALVELASGDRFGATDIDGGEEGVGAAAGGDGERVGGPAPAAFD